MVKMRVLVVAFFLGFVSCSPIKTFEEAEYDIPLQKMSDHRSYFIKQNEMPEYEQQFAKIRELGDEINCKITGNCQGMKRGQIFKKSMFGMGSEDQMMMNAMGGPTGGIGGEDVSGMMGPGKSNFMSDQQQQKDAPLFGQQPQMDIKMTPNEMSAMQGQGQGGQGQGMMGMMGMMTPGKMPGMPGMDGNDALMKLRAQQNNQIIDSSIQDKLKFMESANGGQAPSLPGMPGMPGVTDPLSQFPQAEGKDETAPASNGVSESDLMKAEDIQPNEMKGIDSFLKDSNHIMKQPGESFINDSPSSDNFLGKTGVDFGGSHSSIENNEGGDPNGNEGAGNNPASPMGAGGMSPMTPGGPEVPTLNNLGLGMNSAEMGGASLPNFGFIQDSTRQMIQQNSDYKVPQTAFSNMWNNYIQSSQSLLGERDPSANSRQSIFRPLKLRRRSNVEKPTKNSLKENPNKSNLVYVPAFVIKNVINQVKKSLKTIPKTKTKSSKKNEPPLFITEKHGKRFLVINPDSPLIQGFANVDDQFTSFKMPTFNSGNLYNMNGFPSVPLPELPSQSIPFATRDDFPAVFGGSYPGARINGFPFVGGRTDSAPGPRISGFPLLGGRTDSGGLFRGFVAVPITTRLPFPSQYPSYGGMGHNFYPSYFNRNPLYMNHEDDMPDLHRFAPPSPLYGRSEYEVGEGLTRNYPTQNINLDDGMSFGSHQNMPNDEVPNTFPNNDFSNMFKGYSNDRTHFESNFERPSPFFDNDAPPFFEGNNAYKRSGPGPHPYVFTKDHVGFGPITVEAHTASYKEDPKDDD